VLFVESINYNALSGALYKGICGHSCNPQLSLTPWHVAWEAAKIDGNALCGNRE